uniref:Rho GTPase activating protein 1 n=1 Tax=Prolemur simus TaxID=1328070 RepID=A0A8C9DLF8_PROSS
MDPLSELQDDLTLDDTSQALNQLKLASIDEKNWPSDEMPDFPKSDDSKSSSPEPVTHLKWDDPYYDIARHQIVEVAGDDKYGRKIIVFSACRMPPSHQLDHSKLLGYLKHTLDQYVESDYTLLYLHHGLTSDNKPSLSWLRDAYREFDRKYKKNIKALYIVHPTMFIKTLLILFKPLISFKFGRKIFYVNYLSELSEHVKLEQLGIPRQVLKYDDFLKSTQKSPATAPKPMPPRPPLPNQQFGVSLQAADPLTALVPTASRRRTQTRSPFPLCSGRPSPTYRPTLSPPRGFSGGRPTRRLCGRCSRSTTWGCLWTLTNTMSCTCQQSSSRPSFGSFQSLLSASPLPPAVQVSPGPGLGADVLGHLSTRPAGLGAQVSPRKVCLAPP